MWVKQWSRDERQLGMPRLGHSGALAGYHGSAAAAFSYLQREKFLHMDRPVLRLEHPSPKSDPGEAYSTPACSLKVVLYNHKDLHAFAHVQRPLQEQPSDLSCMMQPVLRVNLLDCSRGGSTG